MTEHSVVIAGGGPTGMMLAADRTMSGGLHEQTVRVACMHRRERWRSILAMGVGSVRSLLSWSVPIAIAGLASLEIAIPLQTPAAKAGGALAVRHARTITVRDSANLHDVGSNGSLRTAEGPVSGTLPGMAHVAIRVSAVRVSGTTVTVGFTFYGRGGSITGHGTGTFHFGLSAQANFAGKGVISRGTGRYRHAHGSGNLDGTVERFGRSGTFQVIGHLSY